MISIIKGLLAEALLKSKYSLENTVINNLQYNVELQANPHYIEDY